MTCSSAAIRGFFLLACSLLLTATQGAYASEIAPSIEDEAPAPVVSAPYAGEFMIAMADVTTLVAAAAPVAASAPSATSSTAPLPASALGTPTVSSITATPTSTSFPVLLKEQKRYRLGAQIKELYKWDDQNKQKYAANPNSKFEVKAITEDSYSVVFSRVWITPEATSGEEKLETKAGTEIIGESGKTSWAAPGVTYRLPRKLEKNTIEPSKYAHESMSGLSGGALIAPFKYRLSNKSISGESTLGAYAGVTFDAPWVCRYSRSFCFQMTPLLSAGLAQVQVAKADGSGTEGKMGFTWATGLMVQNWANMNIGLIYGQDRIGDKEWEHEGKGWLSLSVGWKLAGDK